MSDLGDLLRSKLDVEGGFTPRGVVESNQVPKKVNVVKIRRHRADKKILVRIGVNVLAFDYSQELVDLLLNNKPMLLNPATYVGRSDLQNLLTLQNESVFKLEIISNEDFKKTLTNPEDV